jgi:hypothetical protein
MALLSREISWNVPTKPSQTRVLRCLNQSKLKSAVSFTVRIEKKMEKSDQSARSEAKCSLN